MNYMVGKSASVLVNGSPLRPGERIPQLLLASWGKQDIEDRVRDGFIVPVGDPEVGLLIESTVLPYEENMTNRDGSPSSKSKLNNVTNPSKALENEGFVKKLNEATERLGNEKAKNKPVGKWSVPEESVKDMTLEDLNTLIVEMDPTVLPYDDRAAAVAQLGLDL
jgi:hypothetical protein